MMRDVGPYLPPIGTEHLTRLYSEPTTPLWELTVTRRNVVTIAEIDDPPRISTDPSTPQWAPVISKPSILTRLSGCGTGSHRHKAEDDSTALLTQAMMDRLDRPSEKARTVIPEGTSDAPAPVISEGLEQRVSQNHTESIDMQLERELWELDDDLMADYLDEVDSPDWEVPDISFTVMETAGPQAAQSGGIYPAPSN
jgi:hypothetical protein